MNSGNKKPGKIAEFLLRLMSNESDQFGVLGDFQEIYNELIKSDGMFAAKKWYWQQIIFSFPQFLRNKIYWGVTMFFNYIKIALRTIRKHKGYSFINIAGLAGGLAVGMLMLLYVINELSYDKHIKNVENKYRAVTTINFQGNEFKAGQTAAPAVVELKEEMPEIKSYTRFYSDDANVKFEDKTFKEDNILYAESNFFEFFSVEMLAGNPETALNAPNSVVVTEETATKYFGNNEPLGKVLSFDDKGNFTVTGVCRKNPTTTHFQFDFLASFSTLEKSEYHQRFLNSYMGFNYKSYIELNHPEDFKLVSEKMPEFVERKTGEIAKMFNAELDISFEPVSDIYLFSDAKEDDFAAKGNLNYIILFSIIGVFIILIACINFMNLSTARSINRLKEIGMRKVLGAGRRKIITQLFSESMLFSFLGFLLAVILFYALLPFFSGFVNKKLEIFMLISYTGIAGITFLFLLVGFISGSYPALYVSRNQPVNALLGKSGKTKGSKIFRSVLVNFQFIISIILISATLIIYNQLDYVKNKDLGYDIEQVLVLRLSDESMKDNQQVLKNKIEQIPGVLCVSACSGVPGSGLNITGYKFEEIDLGENAAISSVDVDADYMKTLGLELTQGRFFSEDYGSDKNSVVINETLQNLLGWENPIGRTAEQMDMVDDKPVYVPYTIIGVVKDYHFASLHEKIKPHILFSKDRSRNKLSIKINAANTEEIITGVKSACSEISPNTPVNYFFLDESFYSQYQSEQRLAEIFVYFTLLAIIISSLGLLGLSIFAAEQRRKEVGIRKTLGASTPKIIFMLIKDFLVWIVPSNLIAWPLAYYGMNLWLENFAYRITITPLPFIWAGLIAILISVVTVAYQTLKASVANPIEALKYE